MHAMASKAVPARAFGAAMVAVPVQLHVLIENVVFTRSVMHIEPGLRGGNSAQRERDRSAPR